MQVAQIFKQKKPVVSFEIFPPKRDEALKSIDETLGILTELKPDFISVTFGAGGSVTNSKTVEIASKIKKNFGIEAVAHLTCLNYSKDEIIEMVNNLKANDIDNILALRGDHNPNLAPKNDFMHASDLITFVKQHSDLGISAACYPEGHPEAPSLSEDVINLKRKVDAGAQHLVSQLFFDNDFSKGLSQEKAGAFADALEMLRWAPSAVNKQPWRAVVSKDTVHFYEAKSMKDSSLGDLQKIDMGIGLAHFDLTLKEEGLSGHFVEKDPGIEHDSDVQYIISYEKESL